MTALERLDAELDQLEAGHFDREQLMIAMREASEEMRVWTQVYGQVKDIPAWDPKRFVLRETTNDQNPAT